ncbi:MAG TPA: hypothetical protein P5013_06445 [Methanoregula sp.]|nr:hypothetical protein [Methanoregula sp.]
MHPSCANASLIGRRGAVRCDAAGYRLKKKAEDATMAGAERKHSKKSVFTFPLVSPK